MRRPRSTKVLVELQLALAICFSVVPFAFAQDAPLRPPRRPSKRMIPAPNVPTDVLSGPYFGQELPGDTPLIFADGIISGHNLHSSPSFSPRGDELYWSICDDGPGQCRVHYSEMLESGRWTAPEVASFSIRAAGDNPVFHPNGRRLFFNSSRPLHGVAKERIWYVDREDGGPWSDPLPVDPIINDHALHWQASVDSSGRIYFGSDRTPNFGSDDIFYSDDVNGHYVEPENIGQGINTANVESTPFIDPEGRLILFSRLVGSSYHSIFLSRRNSDGTWADPLDLSDDCQTESGVCPQLSPDGEFLFFLKFNGVDFDIHWLRSSCIPD